MASRRLSKTGFGAAPFDLLIQIGGQTRYTRDGRRERPYTEARLLTLTTQGLSELWAAVVKLAPRPVVMSLARQGINAMSFPAIARTLWQQEQPRRGDDRWAVVMVLDETGLRVIQRMKRFAVTGYALRSK